MAYRALWPGVDLRLHEEAGTLKYEFLVRAGASPSAVRLAYAGASGISLDPSGALLVRTSLGTLRDKAPVSYQTIDGVRVPVESRYALAPQTVALTVTATGRSGERVTSAPAGISVNTGSSGTASFATATSVTLSVSGGRDAVWSGACSSGGSKRKTCSVTLGSSSTVTANVQ